MNLKTKLQKSKTPLENEIKQIRLQRNSVWSLYNKSPNIIKVKRGPNRLQDLIEEKEEDLYEEEGDIQNVSFNLSNCEDMEEFFDNLSNKSDDKVDLEFESTTNEEAVEVIKECIDEETKQLVFKKVGFDENVKKMSSDFYNSIVNNIKRKKSPAKIRKLLSNKNRNSVVNIERMDSSFISEEKIRKIRKDSINKLERFLSIQSNLNPSNESGSSSYILGIRDT